MLEFLGGLFESSFMPHGHCYQWRPEIVWLHAFSDSLIAAAYFAIPFLLVYFVIRRRDLDFRWMFVMFGAFILLCGTTHMLEVWSIWNGTYRLTGSIKLITGVVSMATAVMLVPLVPKALTLPSPAQLSETNESLRRQISARRNAERALRESEQRFRQAFVHAAIGKALVAPDGRFMEVNDALCRIVGYDRDTLSGLRFQEITHPDDLAMDVAHVERLTSGASETYQMEKRYLHREGHVVWVLLSVAAVRDDGGNVLYLVAEIQDVTQARQHEQTVKDAYRALKRSNEELQEFAYVASHDLQEPLRKISAFSDLLRTDCTEALDETGKFYLERIQDSALRMSRLLSDLLGYSRVATHGHSFEPVDLNRVAEGVMRDLELAIRDAEGRVEVGTLPVIEADPTQMHQLLQNLVANSLKYRRPGEKPVVRIDANRVDAKGREDALGTFCRLVVTDNGIGFEQQYADRIFMPFERLHGRAEYEGTGMGLAICRRIAERHSGRIAARSTPGRGSTFTVDLPIRQREREDAGRD